MEQNNQVNAIFKRVRKWAEKDPEHRCAFVEIAENRDNYFNTYGNQEELVLQMAYRMIKDDLFRRIVDRAVAKVNYYDMKKLMEEQYK